MEYILAAWPAIVCFFVMVAACVLTFLYARRHQADPVTILTRVIRTLPHHWKMLRNPAYRRRFRCIESYQKAIFELVQATAARNTLHKIPDDLLAKAYKTTPDKAANIRNFLERALADEFDKMKQTTAPYLASLSDEDIGILAAYLSDEWYGGSVPPAELAEFFRKERVLMAQSPVMVTGHLLRLPRPSVPLA